MLYCRSAGDYKHAHLTDRLAGGGISSYACYRRTVKFSGALPARRVNELLARVEKMQEAVKFAREEANNLDAEDIKVGDRFFEYLFAE
jgi:hypothetical protein